MATGQLAPLLHYLRAMATPGVSSEIADAELLARFCRLRDEAAFTALVRRHGPMVFAVCRRVLRDAHTAEDAFQATFLVLACKADSLARPELLGHWLHGVAYRTAVKARTEAARRRAHEQQAVPAQQSAPDEDFVWRDVRAVLDDEVNRLPARYRVPVVLCYLQGQTNAEAARRLGCSRGTVATLLTRAREKLRRRLTQRGVGLSVGVALAALVETARGAAVPRMLEQVTVKAATLLAAGQTSALGALAAHAVALAKGVSKGMLMEKLKIPTAILMMTAVLGAGAGVTAYRVRAQEGGVAEAEAEAKPRPADKTERARPHARPPVEQPKDQEIAIRTENFVVTAPTPEVAERVAKSAEYQRKALAQLWLGKELPAWAEPCPVRVIVTDKTISGFSTFEFRDGEVLSKEPLPANYKVKPTVIRGGMVLEGPLDRIFADLLPHEMTHTILAEWRGKILPRWADEGAATLSESAAARANHERAMAKILRSGQHLPLGDLLPKQQYPKEITTFYAQSHSLTDFLVSSRGRKMFLTFVARGQDENWNKAAQSVYGYQTVEELEQAWLEHARKQLAEIRAEEPMREAPSTKTRQPKPRPAPVPGEALAQHSFQGQLPTGAAPVQALVVLDDDGRLTVNWKITSYHAVTTISKDGQNRTVTTYQPKHDDVAIVYDYDKVRVFDSKGREVDKSGKAVRESFKKESLVLVSADGRPVDPLHLRLIKEGTAILILPRQAARAVPGKDPIAPSAAPPVPVPAVPAQPVFTPPPPVISAAPAVAPAQIQAGSIKIEASAKGVTVKVGNVQASAQSVDYDEARERLELVGSDDVLATLVRKRSGQPRQMIRARKIIYSLKDGMCDVPGSVIEP